MTVGLKSAEATSRRGVPTASGEALLARLSIAFADPVRLRIITELFHREMSPSQFQAEFGGGSLEAVCRQFKKLEQHGWLRLVRTDPHGRRGRARQVFRAPEMAVFDEPAWGLLPRTLREEFSWRTFEQFAERVKWAFEAETIDARDDRHFTWTPLVLDEQGRAVVFSAARDLFYSLFEEQQDAKLRIERSEEIPVHVTVGISAFDSPTRHRNRSGLLLPASDSTGTDRDSASFFPRISKVFRHPLNLKIIAELNVREMSPSQFHREFVADAQDVYRRFRTLAADGWLEVTREDTGGRRRGATERFFRATGPAIFDTQNWARVPKEVRGRFTWRIFEQLAEQVREAMDAETFDSQPDRAHTWTPLLLDERGWRQICSATDHLFDFMREEERRAAVRLRQPDAEPPEIATACLAVFESPADPPSGDAAMSKPWPY